MRLKTAKTIVWGISIAILCAVAIFVFLPVDFKKPCIIAIVALLGLDAVFCVFFLRCPHCHGQIYLFGQKYCPSCGEEVE